VVNKDTDFQNSEVMWCGESTESDEMDVCTLASDILGCICVCVFYLYIYTL